MAMNDKLIETLNDLIQINTDRANGFKNASEDVENIDVDLKTVFAKMSSDSSKMKADLAAEVSRLGGETPEGTSILGSIHQAWMDVKATFTGKDRETILNSCEFGEDNAVKAYTDALKTDADIDVDTRQLITSQMDDIKSGHDTIKKLRDAQKAMS